MTFDEIVEAIGIEPYHVDRNAEGELRGVIYCGDCLDILPKIPEKSIDLVLTDPPYGTTGNTWDVVPNLNKLWNILAVLCDGRAVISSSQPFTTDLINSNREWFKYCWIWNKSLAGNGILAKRQPLKIHEDICVFGDIPYYPIMKKGRARIKGGIKDNHGTFGGANSAQTWNDDYYPCSIVEFSGAAMRQERKHPTQKPIELMAYMIETYSTDADLVCDPFAGSFTTCVAAKQLGRKYIGIEISEEYCEIGVQRLAQEELF